MPEIAGERVFNADMPDSYLQNSWYAAAWSHEVGEAPFDITICGARLVLLRKENGDVAAISGICPHRFAPLALGQRVAGDGVQCPYHGLVFGAEGRCIGNPHGPLPNVRLATYHAVERHSIIWIWMGQAAAADAALIPDFSIMADAPGRRVIRGRLLTNAHFELVTDNLLDLSHVGFLHKDGLGNEAIAKGVHKVTVAGTTIQSNRWCPDAPPSPVWSIMFGGYKDNVDHWLDMRWDPPSNMLLDVGVTAAGQPRETGVCIFSVHLLTPETPASTHYMWSASRSFDIASTALDANIAGAVEQAFVKEDKPMLEQVQKNMGERSFEEMRPLIMRVDEGAMRARAMLNAIRSGRQSRSFVR